MSNFFYSSFIANSLLSHLTLDANLFLLAADLERQDTECIYRISVTTQAELLGVAFFIQQFLSLTTNFTEDDNCYEDVNSMISTVKLKVW